MNPDGRPEAPVQTSQDALDIPMIDGALDSLLGRTPAQYVAALAETGLCLPMPPGVPVAPERVIAGIGSLLELFIASDYGLIVEAWERVRRTKGAQAAIHLRSDPERSIMLTLIDARHRYGVFLGFVSANVGFIKGEDEEVRLFRPRLCTMWRDELSIIRDSDDAMTKILGWSRAELIGKRTLDLVHPDDRAVAIAHWMGLLGHPGSDQRIIERYGHRDGKYIWFEFTNHNLLNDPAHHFVRSEMFDISERIEAAEALRASEQLLRRLTETLPLGIVQIDTERRIVYRNERLGEIVNVANAITIDEQLAQVAAADHPILDAALDALLSAGEPADIELKILHAGGARHCSVGMRALSAESGTVTGGIVCVADITERVVMREELEMRAKYDDLTHCHNRVSILEILDALLQDPDRHGAGMAVLFVDLDRFKAVNDRYGHAAGDELLRRIGQRLLHSVRTGDIVGRFGGDEFLVVCPDVLSPELALEIARRATTAIAQRVVLGVNSVLPAASIGVAWTNCRIDSDAFVASADAAMYESKRGDHQPVLCLPLSCNAV
jgi:diguanylate cyclase (GGDEF)-like protein/PAS domain S-box-containing protein